MRDQSPDDWIFEAAKNIQYFKKAKELLEKLYLELDPYKPNPFSKELIRELQDFFGFDDSE